MTAEIIVLLGAWTVAVIVVLRRDVTSFGMVLGWGMAIGLSVLALGGCQ